MTYNYDGQVSVPLTIKIKMPVTVAQYYLVQQAVQRAFFGCSTFLFL